MNLAQAMQQNLHAHLHDVGGTVCLAASLSASAQACQLRGSCIVDTRMVPTSGGYGRAIQVVVGTKMVPMSGGPQQGIQVVQLQHTNKLCVDALELPALL